MSEKEWNIIIRQGKTSRWLRGPFNLCGDYSVLREIAEQILSQTTNDHHNQGYGNLIIQPRPVFGTSNTTPSEWEESNETLANIKSETPARPEW